ncbi:M20 family metallo-hydrolase [uncultured Roseibium sp.]|uniref:M20 family metallo-hydrolase n=1 Tax=uncultured Roseibium sp. TaxID=1936171 RepID=UPI0025929C26|nr:M20 family metallo-hydrolase [uncultured Roseibium sp.]
METGLTAENRLIEIAECSLPGDGVTRFPFTDEHSRANHLIAKWMRQAGMEVWLDAAGTLIGRLAGQGARASQTFILGSHQDSVLNGGGFDGIMGVALACLAVEQAFAEGTEPDFSIEVHAYADEEGVRFPTALLGPRALVGSYDPQVFKMRDNDNVSLKDALAAFGGKPGAIHSLKRNPDDTLGYLEMHIEQGPVLERENLAVGVVTGICGIERNTLTLHGKTGHAGTVPMQGRRDALVAAARIIFEIQKEAKKLEDLRATTGTLSILPGAVNQIPEIVSFSLEIRSPDDAGRNGFRSFMIDYANSIAEEQGCRITVEQTYEQPAQDCDTRFRTLLEAASTSIQGRSISLPSGATHDASAMAALCPIGMLFVRCRDGVSHVPEEYASPEDMGQAIEIAARFLRTL